MLNLYDFSGAGKSTLMTALANKLPGNNLQARLYLEKGVQSIVSDKNLKVL